MKIKDFITFDFNFQITCELAHPFQKLAKLGQTCIIWMAQFHNPKHTGDRQRLDRLEEETRIVMRITSYLKHQIKDEAVNACFRHADVGEKLSKHLKMLINEYRSDPARHKDSDDSGEEQDTLNDDEKNTATAMRIAKLFLRKRYLLNIIFFIFANEEDIASKHKEALKRLEELAIDDANDWMELLDYVETMKNPKYLG